MSNIMKAESIYVFKDGKPVPIYLGLIYKDDNVIGRVDSTFHLAYEDTFYQYRLQAYTFSLSQYRDENNNVVFRITPNDLSLPRFSDLVIDIKNNSGEDYIINIFTTDTSEHWDYYTDRDIPVGEYWIASIRNSQDQYWNYYFNVSSITIE